MIRNCGFTLCFTLTLFLPSSLVAQESPQVSELEESEQLKETAPVVLDGQELFRVHGLKAISAESRAGKISERIKEFADDSAIPTSALTVQQGKAFSDIVAGEKFVLTILDSDAQQNGVTRQWLAQRIVRLIGPAAEQYRRDRSPRSLIRSALLTALVTLVYVLSLWLLFRLNLLNWAQKKIRPIHLKSYEVVRAEWLLKALLLLGRLFRILVVAWLSLLYLQLVLSLFPWTRPVAYHVLNYLVLPLRAMGKGFLAQIPNLLFLIVLAFVVHFVLKVVRYFFSEVEQGKLVITGFYPDWSHPTYNIIRVLVLVFATIIAFPYIPGSSSPAFQGISIFLGVLLSLGSTSAVANAVAGIILTYMRAFRTGDFVQIGESRGIVTGTTLLVTRIRTIKQVDITVPNSMVLGTHVTNYSNAAREKKLLLHTTVTIGYDTPWRQVEALLLLAAKRTPTVLQEPAPYVLQTSLGDFYITYELNAVTDSPATMQFTYGQLHANIQDAFNEYGVQILSPNYMMDRAAPTFVPKERWYAPPASPLEPQGKNGIEYHGKEKDGEFPNRS